jgi:hypothetical protein
VLISKRVGGVWKFSDTAAVNLKAYVDTFPDVIAALRESIMNRSNLNIKTLFKGNATQVDQQLGVLGKFIKQRTFARLVPVSHYALSSAAIKAIEDVVASSRVDLEKTSFTAQDQLVSSAQLLEHAGHSKHLPELGQRVIYCGDSGFIPAGTRGTVIGVYGDERISAQVELLLDEKSLGASSLHGRCSEMCGILVRADSIIFLNTIEIAHVEAIEHVVVPKLAKAKSRGKASPKAFKGRPTRPKLVQQAEAPAAPSASALPIPSFFSLG